MIWGLRPIRSIFCFELSEKEPPFLRDWNLKFKLYWKFSIFLNQSKSTSGNSCNWFKPIGLIILNALILRFKWWFFPKLEIFKTWGINNDSASPLKPPPKSLKNKSSPIFEYLIFKKVFEKISALWTELNDHLKEPLWNFS